MDSHNITYSPHARVRVINFNEYEADMRTKEELLMNDDGGSASPKKLPAKIINVFKKDPIKKDDKKVTPTSAKVTKVTAKLPPGNKDVLPIPMPDTNDEALSEFLSKVNTSSHSRDTTKKSHVAHAHQQQQQHNVPASPQQHRNSFSMLPEYARYQEVRFQRALSRGNSFSSLNNVSPGGATAPGVEWVDHRVNPPTVHEHGWDSSTLVARHSYPSNIYCARGEGLSSVQAAAMAAMHQEYGGYHHDPHYPPPPPHHHHHQHPHSAPPSPAGAVAPPMRGGDMIYHHGYHHTIHRRSYPDAGGGSIPSAAAISQGSSSSWSEDEEQRQYMDYMAYAAHHPHSPHSPHPHSPHSPHHHHPHPHHHHHHHQTIPQHQQHAPPSAAAAAAAASAATPAAARKEEQDLPLVEISPGVHEPLRKANETVHAVRHDFYVPVCCFGCSADIFSIADAKYVICPKCRVVSPIEEGALEGQVLRQHGLGLGFTCDSLFQIQSEILLEQR